MVIFNNKYIEYFKIGFKKSIEYKSYLFGIFLSPFLIGFFYYFIWKFIFENKYLNYVKEGVFNGNFSSFTIGGFTFSEMIVYLIIGLLINSVRSQDLPREISQLIKSGDITIFLCRPVNFVKSVVFESFGSKFLRILIFMILLIFMTYFFNINYPKGFLLIIFLFYAIFMVLFDIFLYILIGGLSFWFVEIFGFQNSIEHILWILSGRALPLSLFPSWF
jgi:ABC-2 type transport system permease protein